MNLLPLTKPDGTCFWHELPMGGKFGCLVCDQEVKEGKSLVTPERLTEVQALARENEDWQKNPKGPTVQREDR